MNKQKNAILPMQTCKPRCVMDENKKFLPIFEKNIA